MAELFQVLRLKSTHADCCGVVVTVWDSHIAVTRLLLLLVIAVVFSLLTTACYWPYTC